MEKHNTSLRRRGGRRRRRCPAMNEHINCSNSVGAGGGQLCLFVPSRCNHVSTAWLSPALFREGWTHWATLCVFHVSPESGVWSTEFEVCLESGVRCLRPEPELRTVICHVLLKPDHCFLQLSNWRTKSFCHISNMWSSECRYTRIFFLRRPIIVALRNVTTRRRAIWSIRGDIPLSWSRAPKCSEPR